jgi:ribosome-associated protein
VSPGRRTDRARVAIGEEIRALTAASASEPAALVERAGHLALERKALDVVSLDLRGISSATDYFLLATGTSDTHVKSIADHIIDELRKEGVRANHVEGLQGGRWVLIDYIDVVVHVFQASVRDFYQLEELWGDAERTEYEES